MNENWEYRRIGDICTVERGGSPRPIDSFITDSDDGINWIKIGDADDTMYITKTAQKIKPEGIKKSRYVRPGDFLLSNSMSFGKPYILKISGCIHDGWLVLRDEECLFDKRFLYFYLSSPSTYNQFKTMAVGGVVNNLNSEMVRNVEIPIPNMEEQLEIVKILEKLQSLIVARKQQLYDFDTLIKARFMELFGNPITREKDEELKALGDYCDLKAGKFVKASDIVENNVEGLYPCFGGNGQRGFVSDYTHDGDFPIIGRQGALCGNVQYASGKFHATEHAVVVTPRIEMDRYWLYYLLLQLNLNRYATGAAQPGLAVSNLEKIHVSVPKLSLQKKFADFARQSDKSKYVAPHK